MDFEWDEEKRLTNIEKHGIDFIDADILFGNPHLVAPGAAGHPHDLDAECKKWRKKKASGGLRKLN
jgi:uncharacterized protein